MWGITESFQSHVTLGTGDVAQWSAAQLVGCAEGNPPYVCGPRAPADTLFLLMATVEAEEEDASQATIGCTDARDRWVPWEVQGDVTQCPGVAVTGPEPLALSIPWLGRVGPGLQCS